ncbi:MAG: putative metal-binding motif-containing protein, partial [Bacteroidetes bacterium]|nr:putative metal-binding motif-containing protein [Bacteroidota bacterium]
MTTVMVNLMMALFLNYYVDADGDGFGAGLATSSCNPIVGSVLVDGDCDDNAPLVNPGATEVCNGIDDDCANGIDDGLVFLNYYVDADGDGYGAGLATSSCNPIVGSVLVDGDCDDNNAAVNPSATEVCNGIDDDCANGIDDGLVFLNYYVDADGDGFGAGLATSSCNPIVGSVLVDGDCDDNAPLVNPGATEVCNGIDDDCNANGIDDGLTFLNYYVDADGDGFGAGLATSSCNPIVGSVLVDGDCDDKMLLVNPGATEVCNGIDDDCNGLSDDGLTFLNYYVDVDGDGYGAGLATSSCNPIVGSVLVDGDCDDNNAAVNPGATEVCNGIDDDCANGIDDGLVFLNYYVDADGDGFGAGLATSSCNPIVGSVLVDGDCDDNAPLVNPSATEVCNGIDDDCNGLSDDGLVFLNYYVDADGDGFGAGLATSSCNPIVGSVLVD